MQAIRGAITVDSNDSKEIAANTTELFGEICRINKLEECELVSLIISLTPDLTKYNPATALRDNGMLISTPLFCVQEPFVEGMLPLCIRILVLTNQKLKEPVHVYLKKARSLRPDLVGK
ncbi:MAG: chorismate mutase [Sphaerochaetaceae bacterium]|jgi:chorismate mutase|nr:chorismate mutase [Sphaerochaetaceae bacterium]NLY07798.1 chorismate mutase [Spirochaetales bacterium]